MSEVPDWRPDPTGVDATAPLAGVKVLDCSTLLPGPLATLLLADAGADVIKVERPGGEEMRRYEPRFGASSANFALLNAGKRSVELDLKDPAGVRAFRGLLESADVLVEQFRPGVMERLGLGWETVRTYRPDLVYCSISGYGQDGPNRDRAGHDLTYLAESGMLALAADSSGAPPLPPALVADIAGGAYPAVFNILAALRRRDLGGGGGHLDIAMADNLFPLMYWALGAGFAAGRWPRPGGELVTGGSPRYRVYRTADGRYLAAAPLEDRFWRTFCEVVALPDRWRDEREDAEGAIAAVQERVGTATAAEWERRFAGRDACVAVVRTLSEAVAAPQATTRALFGRLLDDGAATMPALPSPWAPALRPPSGPGADGHEPADGVPPRRSSRA